MNKFLITLLVLLTMSSPTVAQEKEPELFFWTGFVQPKDSKAQQVVKDPLTLDEVEAKIARIKHDLQTTRKVKAAEAEISALWHHVNLKCAMPLDVRKEQLIAVAIARSKIYGYSQSWEKAKSALFVLGLTNGDSDPSQPSLIVRVSREHESWLREISKDVRLKNARSEISLKSLSGQPSGQVQRLKLSDELEIYIQSNFGEIGNSLFTHVGKSLREGNPEAITQLGDRAIAPLALYILNDLKDSKEIFNSDPFLVLQSIDREVVNRIIKDYFAEANTEWRFRAYQSYETRRKQILSYDKDVRTISFGRRPHICDLAKHFLEDQLLRPKAILHYNDFRYFKPLPEDLEGTLIRIAANEDVERANFALNWSNQFSPDGKEKALSTALNAEEDDLRVSASNFIRSSGESLDLLIPLAADPSEHVRQNLAWSLMKGKLEVVRSNGKTTYPFLDRPEVQEALGLLLRDSSERVRGLAFQALLDKSSWTMNNVDIYLAAMKTIPENSALQFAGLKFSESDDQDRFIQGLLASSNETLITAFDRHLLQFDWTDSPAAYSEGLKKRLTMTDPPFPNLDHKFFEHTNSNAFFSAVTSRLRQADLIPMGIRLCVEANRLENLTPFASTPQRMSDALNELPAKYSLSILSTNSSASDWAITSAMERIIPETEISDEDLQKIVTIPSIFPPARVAALQALFERGSSNAKAASLELLASPPLDWTPGMLESLTKCYYRAPETQLDFLRTVNENLGANPKLGFLFLLNFSQSSTPKTFIEPLFDLILSDQFHVNQRQTSVIMDFIHEQGLTLLHRKKLIRAIQLLNSQIYPIALDCIQKSQNPVFIADLGGLIRNPVNHPKWVNMAAIASYCLASYRTKEAADELIVCLEKANDEKLRALLLGHLNDLRTYFEQRNYWQGFETHAPNRDGAVNELLTMLKDPDPEIRAAAVSGLVPLGKPEVIPRIIPLIKDENQMVRDAAKKAIEKLQDLAPETGDN
jgi:hypothetical protein